ncbi:hypothetical protein, partial [Neisseria meningitidis]
MTSANFNINGFGDVKLTPYSPLLGYKAWDSFIGSIQSLSDLIYNVDNNRNKMEITVNNAIQAADSFLSSIGRDNKITNTASLLASLDNIFLNLRNVSRDIRETGKFKPNDIQQAIGDIFIAAGDGLQYIKQQTEAMAQSKFLPTKLKTGLNDVLNSRMLKSSTVLQHELNYLGFKIKDYGNERLGESIMNIDDFTPSKIANFFADPDTYSNVLEEVSRFIYSLVPDDANPWKGGEDYIGRGISEWGELLEKWYKQDFLPYLEKEWDQFPKFEDWLPEFPEWAREWLKLDPKRSGKYHVYDPLALDLDGDGIETVAAKGFAGALFDHRNQGIRTATGWVSADDGLLVRDLNGNGII